VGYLGRHSHKAHTAYPPTTLRRRQRRSSQADRAPSSPVASTTGRPNAPSALPRRRVVRWSAARPRVYKALQRCEAGFLLLRRRLLRRGRRCGRCRSRRLMTCAPLAPPLMATGAPLLTPLHSRCRGSRCRGSRFRGSRFRGSRFRGLAFCRSQHRGRRG
jgi:hypothetical protein